MQDDELVKQIAQQLDDSTESLDYATQLKLQRIRQQALQVSPKESMVKRFWQPMSAFLVTASLAAVVVFNTQQTTAPTSNHQTEILEDIELLAADEELEFIQNLEFYEWLDKDGAQQLES
ncbi:DUF3619 family protein [Pleionea sp. CnH1-48]|uniref:DUF3619 family protein n=1 Tax=Pleionea sp. CnH1-48 TaxID=2954494 RepID=UPI0020983874|nr:DUF3619 family protein [Pleionea sp. CnH1-48]MCO7222827.1 DUF3619 family protein [Pleionea sp. CnH1-48]